MGRNEVAVHLGTMFVLIAGISLNAPPALSQAPLPITIAYLETPDWLLYTARDQKLFERAGLAPTYVKFGAGVQTIEPVRGGSVDIAHVGSVPFLIGRSQGVDWVMIGIPTESAYAEGIVARKDSGIEKLADLRGKRIGYFRASTSHYLVMRALRQVGLRPDQVTLLHMPPAEQVAALAKKELDAAVVWEPWVRRMVHEASARIIATGGDLGIDVAVGSYSARREWLRDNRETAVRFLEALLMAHDVLQKDPMVGVRVVAQELGISEAWAESIYHDAPPPRIAEWANPRYASSLVKGSAFQRRLGYLATFLLEEKIVPQPPELREALDASVITEALKRGRRDQ